VNLTKTFDTFRFWSKSYNKITATLYEVLQEFLSSKATEWGIHSQEFSGPFTKVKGQISDEDANTVTLYTHSLSR